MPSSISSSDQTAAWRAFFGRVMASGLGLGLLVYGFIVVVDPWDALPGSAALPRAQLSQDGRFFFPSLARSSRFDSAVLGTSTSRLLRPDLLDRLLGGSFVNLSMNSASPYEQSRLLAVFTRRHPEVKTLILTIDFRWCAPPDQYAQASPYLFPNWLYSAHRWSAYLHVFSLHALHDSLRQASIMLGLASNHFGLDGYTNFLPDDRLYDPARARQKLAPPPQASVNLDEPVDDPDADFPALALLADELATVPAGARTLIVFTPEYAGAQPVPGTDASRRLDACKFRIARLAEKVPGSLVVDFDIPSPITRESSNFWDNLHYRVGIADRIVADLAQALEDPATASPDYRLLGDGGSARGAGL